MKRSERDRVATFIDKLTSVRRSARLLKTFQRISGRTCGFTDGGCWVWAQAVRGAVRASLITRDPIVLLDKIEQRGRTTHVYCGWVCRDGLVVPFDASGRMGEQRHIIHNPITSRETVWMNDVALAAAKHLKQYLLGDVALYSAISAAGE